MSAKEVVTLTQELIRIPSTNPPGGEERCARYLADWLAEHGIQSRVEPVAAGRANLVARIPGEGCRPGVLLCGHLDTVPVGNEPWPCDPFGGEIRNGYVYGRGASDMKGGIAAMACAMAAIVASGCSVAGDVILALTADEEEGCLGARALATSGVLPPSLGLLIVAEPTGLCVASCHKGVLWLEVEAWGKAAHAAMPDLGVNAVSQMARVISALEGCSFDCPQHSLLGRVSLAVTSVNGGVKINMIPDYCAATVDIRTVPGCDSGALLARLGECLGDLEIGRVAMRILREYAPVETPVDSPFVRAAVAAARAVRGRSADEPCGMAYYTDASVLAPATGLPVILYGPGDPGLAHQVGERVEVNALIEAESFFLELLRLLLT